MGSDMPEEIFVYGKELGLGTEYFGARRTNSADYIRYIRDDIPAARIAVLEQVLEHLMDDLSQRMMQFPGHSVCEQVWNEGRQALNSGGGAGNE